MSLYSNYKKKRTKFKRKPWVYNFRLFKRKVGFFIPYHISLFYIKHILHIKITKVLPDVNGVAAIKYAFGKLNDGKGEKVFVKICIRRRHRNTNVKLVRHFTQVSNYKNKKINYIYALKQGIFLNFMVMGYIENFMDLEELFHSKEYKNSKNKKKLREKLCDELNGIVANLKKTKIVHYDVHKGNIIIIKNSKEPEDFYLALTDFSLAKQYDSSKKWHMEFTQNDEKEFKKLSQLLKCKINDKNS